MSVRKLSKKERYCPRLKARKYDHEAVLRYMQQYQERYNVPPMSTEIAVHFGMSPKEARSIIRALYRQALLKLRLPRYCRRRYAVK